MKPKIDLRADFKAFRDEKERARGPQCTGCRLKAKHPDTMGVAEDLLNEGERQSTVSEWLKGKGLTLSVQNLGEHWRKHVQGRA